MKKSSSRRSVLRWLAAAPLTGVVASACGETVGSDAGAAADSGLLGADAGEVCVPTHYDAEGPFYEGGAPARAQLAETGEPGERLLLSGTLLSSLDCATPLGGYTLDLWQADATGLYHEGSRLRGVIDTSSDGGFSVETVVPGNYPDAGGFRPAHIHAKVWTPSGELRLTTQIYFAGDPYLFPNDSCAPPTCFSDDPGRIVTLRDGRIGGVDGRVGSLNLIVRA